MVAHLGHVADEVEVPAPRIGHALEQALVEVGPHAERARGHAAPAQVVGEPGELVVIGDADVGEAVGEQQDAVHALGREAGGDLLAARQPAPVEVGRAAGVDGLEPLGGERPALGGGDDAVDHDLDLVVVDHRREAVGRLQPVDGLEDRLAGEADLVLAAHRAGAVEDEAQVDRRPAARRIRGDRGRDQVDEQEALAAAVGADEPPIGTHGEPRIEESDGCGVIGVGGHGVPLGVQGSSSNRSRAIRASRSTSLLERRSSGRRTWISMSGVIAMRSQVLRSTGCGFATGGVDAGIHAGTGAWSG